MHVIQGRFVQTGGVQILAVDSRNPGVARLSATMVLSVFITYIIDFNEKGF